VLSRHLSLNAILTALLAVLLLGCGATPASALPPLSGHGGLSRSHPTGTVTLPPPPPPLSAFTYDTSIGNGVDTNGIANLPLKAGDHHYYVNSSTGSNANNCTAAQSGATPKQTIAAGFGCMTDGHGDQLLIAEGTTYAETLPSMLGKVGGFSYLYPFTFQSYDPTDPTNEAKMGRANGSGSHARPILTGAYPGLAWMSGSVPTSYVALRGLDFNAGNLADQSLGGSSVGSGLLFENLLVRYADLEFTTSGGSTAHHWIFRGNGVSGSWSASSHMQGIYVSGADTITIEDNVLYHNGWKIGGAGRDSATEGATVFRHAIYQQVNGNSVSRRNLIVDGAADGGSHRGNALIQANLGIDNPIMVAAGGGVAYDVMVPFGDALDVSFNAYIGGADVTSSLPRRMGIDTENGRPFSLAHHNLLVRNSVVGPWTFSLQDTDGAPSYMTFDHNVAYQRSTSGSALQIAATGFGSAGNLHATFTNNIWDDPASGSNVNSGGVSFPNAYTQASLYSALGYADKAAFVNYAIANPDAHPGRAARTLLMAGYGATSPPLADLAMATKFTIGAPDVGIIVGTQDGDPLTASGLPSCLTLDSGTRSWIYDGTCSAGASSFTLTETGATSHNTTVNYTVYTPPILTASSAVQSGSTTGTLATSTTVGNGTLYWVRSASPIDVTVYGEVVRAHTDTNAHTAYAASGSQAVSGSGAQSIAATGLTTGTNGYDWLVHVDSGNTWSKLTYAGAFTPGLASSTWNPDTHLSPADWVLSGGNLIGTRSTSGDALLLGNGEYLGGARYFEVTVNSFGGSGGGIEVGLGAPTINYNFANDYLHDHVFSYISDGRLNKNSTNLATGLATFGAGNVIGVLVDNGSGTTKVYVQKDGVDLGGSNANARTGGLDISDLAALTPKIVPGVSSNAAAGVTLNVGASAFAHLPTSALAWSPGAGFSPSSLSPILWVEADPTKLYTDAGTTLVSADGQAVYQANDKSGNSNHLIQATLGNRPIYKTGSGKPYLQFTAANSSYMQTAAGIATGDGSGQNWIAVSGQIDSAAAANWLAASASGIGTFAGSAESWLTTSKADWSSGPADFGNSATATVVDFLGGRIYAVLLGPGTLNSTQRGNLQTYLAALHP
jgi:hypothetical protein